MIDLQHITQRYPTPEEQRQRLQAGWQKAVQRAKDWAED